MPCGAHLVGVRAENSVVVGRVVPEFVLDFIAHLVAVSFARAARHADPAERIYAAAKRRIRLKPNDDFVLAVDVARGVRRNRGHAFRVHVQNSALSLFLG